jgi:hypothetical protein
MSVRDMGASTLNIKCQLVGIIFIFIMCHVAHDRTPPHK